MLKVVRKVMELMLVMMVAKVKKEEIQDEETLERQDLRR